MAYPDRPAFNLPQMEGAQFLSCLMPTGIALPQGDRNNVELVTDPTKRLYVKRERDEFKHAQGLQFLTTVVYPALGFLQSGGKVWGRSNREQAEHMERAAFLGVDTPKPVYVDDQRLIYQYMPGINLREHLTQGGSNSVIDSVLTTVSDAHGKGVIHGDRQTRNIIIQPDGRVVHIDFDYAIGGSNAAEFEMAMLLYPILGLTAHFDNAVERTSQFARSHSDQYDWHVISNFMQKYQQYLNGHPIGKDMHRLIPRLGEKLDVATTSLLKSVT